MNGPVKTAQLKKGSNGTFVVKAKIVGKLPGAMGAVTLRPPAPGTDGGMIFTIIGGDRYCVTFGGTAGGLVTNSVNKSFTVKATTVNPTAETGCPVP